MRIKCPGCAALQDIDESLQGTVYECTTCGRLMRIPAPDTQSRAAPASPLKTSIRADPPKAWAGPLAPDETTSSTRDGGATSPDDLGEETPPAARKQGRRRKRRRVHRAESTGGLFAYFTGVLGTFGWILVGLVGLWLGSIVLALTLPVQLLWPLWLGSALVVVGNAWIGFVAYQDSHVFGMLCFFTFLFTYVYIVMNPSETWRPASLVGMGFLFVISGWVLS